MSLDDPLRGLNDGPGREVIQSPGVALKRTVPVRLGRVTGVPRFRGQAEIGELQGFHHFDLLAE